jgi:beta-glucanase (GH16 family)
MTSQLSAFLYPGEYVLYDHFTSINSDLWGVSDWRGSLETRYLPANVVATDSKLALTAYVDNHTGGEVTSRGTYGFGLYRASMKLDQTPDTYMAFFTFKGPIPDGHNEIDIEISKQGANTTVNFNVAYRNGSTGGQYVLPFDPAEAYHLYGFNWYDDRVEFFIDDMDKPIYTAYDSVPQEPSYLLFNDFVVNKPSSDHGTGINTLYVDWVTIEPID